MDRHMRHSGPPTKYKHGDKVLLRLKSRKGRIAPKRRHFGPENSCKKSENFNV